MNLRIEMLDTRADSLGECPLWDPRDQSLYWIDSRGCSVQRWRGGQWQTWSTPAQVGAIALTRSGRLLLALEQGFSLLDLAHGGLRAVAQVQHDQPGVRLNDGRTDRQGRFVVGALVQGGRSPAGAYHRLEPDGRVTRLFGGIALANTTCFSPDGRFFYHADCLSGCVSVADYEPATGEVGARRVLVDTRVHGSVPDGATVDAEGRLWIALVQSGCIGCFSPSGELLRLIELPTPHPSCCCFGGPGLDVLYVTSIRDSGHLLRSEHPAAGRVFALHGLGARGLPEVPFDDEALA